MMPTIDCCHCKRLQTIPTDKWKLLLSGEDYACSARCVLGWIERTVRPMWQPENEVGLVGMGIKSVFHDKTFYKSNFEYRFAKFLIKRHVKFYYERYAFPVERAYYTPDFYLYDYHKFIETKGKWGLGQKSKFHRFRIQHPDVKILVVPWILQEEF